MENIVAASGLAGKGSLKLQAGNKEKKGQITRLRDFQARHAEEAPVQLARLKQAAISGGNVFAILMDAARCCSLGQITDALFEVGGQYRRNM